MAGGYLTFSLSLVVPILNETDNIPEFLNRCTPIINTLTPEWEILFIDDGSKDGSFELIKKEHNKDKRIKIISFSRNFGKEIALSAGLEHATGDVVVPIDVDLQDPPELIPKMIEYWKKGYKVILPVRESRKEDSLLKRLTAHCFYKLIRIIASIDIPSNVGDFRLMDREVVNVIKNLPERSRFMKGLLAWPGFKTKEIYFKREHRHHGKSRLTYWKLWRLAWDGIFSFSAFPLVIWIYIGSIISILAFAYASFILVKTLLYGIDWPGYASIMVTVLFLGGIQLISLGVIGQYLNKVFKETKQRPLYVIEKKHGL